MAAAFLISADFIRMQIRASAKSRPRHPLLHEEELAFVNFALRDNGEVRLGVSEMHFKVRAARNAEIWR